MTPRARRAVLVPLAAAALAACAPRAVVVVSPGYDPARVKTAALASFADFPGAAGSGEVAAGALERSLLQAGYRLVDPGQADALAIGALADYQGARDETVMVDVPQEQSDPIYGRIVTTRRSGDERVRTTQDVVTGYAVTRTSQLVPETQTVPAHVALSVRFIDAKTSELLWSASASASGEDLAAAAETAADAAVGAVLKQVKKRR